MAEADVEIMVDAAAVADNFEMMTRLADGTGAVLPAERVARAGFQIATMGAADLVSRR